MTYDAWVQAVDDAVRDTAGISIHDLPDIDFRGLYDDGDDPADVAADALTDAGWEG